MPLLAGVSLPCYFNPRHPWGRRPDSTIRDLFRKLFQPTPPVGAATLMMAFFKTNSTFQPTPPVGAATPPALKITPSLTIFQPTPPVGAATAESEFNSSGLTISTHATRGGGDAVRENINAHVADFNPRHPWGRRPMDRGRRFVLPEFQPTPPVGAATSQ